MFLLSRPCTVEAFSASWTTLKGVEVKQRTERGHKQDTWSQLTRGTILYCTALCSAEKLGKEGSRGKTHPESAGSVFPCNGYISPLPWDSLRSYFITSSDLLTWWCRSLQSVLILHTRSSGSSTFDWQHEQCLHFIIPKK